MNVKIALLVSIDVIAMFHYAPIVFHPCCTEAAYDLRLLHICVGATGLSLTARSSSSSSSVVESSATTTTPPKGFFGTMGLGSVS